MKAQNLCDTLKKNGWEDLGGFIRDLNESIRKIYVMGFKKERCIEIEVNNEHLSHNEPLSHLDFLDYEFEIISQITMSNGIGCDVRRKQCVSLENFGRIVSAKNPFTELGKLPETSSVEPISQVELMRKHFFI